MQIDAPFEAEGLRVQEDWIDYNGHLNMAYYNVMFDQAVDQAFEWFGLGAEYLKEHSASYYTLEVHINYLREVHLNTPVRLSLQMLDFDAKRVHYFIQMHHETEGWVAATSEQLCMHIDMTEKRSSPFPDHVLARIEAMYNAHKDLPRASQIGHVIGIKRK